MRIIGINGLKTSGKDATYAAIAKYSPSPLRVAFADKLKLHGALSLGLEGTDEQLLELMNKAKESWMIHLTDSSPFANDPDVVFHDLTGREYLQHLGNHARRLYGESFWVDQVLPETYGEVVEKYDYVDTLVVTDVRYPNEAVRVRQVGGEVWEVIRPGLSSDGHASETPLPSNLVDKTIMNDGSLVDLETTVREALEC